MYDTILVTLVGIFFTRAIILNAYELIYGKCEAQMLRELFKIRQANSNPAYT